MDENMAKAKPLGLLGYLFVGGKMLFAALISSALTFPLDLIGYSLISLFAIFLGFIITGFVDIKLWKFEKDEGLLSYFITGLKHFVAGLISIIIIILLALLVGGVTLLTLLVSPWIFIFTLGVILIFVLPVLLIVMGYVANNICKWK